MNNSINANSNENISLSLLDRLTTPTKTTSLLPEDLREKLIHSVERDLQNLLNTRKMRLEIPDELTELEPSLIDYGIPDLTTINIYSEQQKKDFCQAVQKAIETYEPRLRDAKVELVEAQKQIELIFRLRINAILLIDPKPIPVSFDSPLYSDTRLFAVQGKAVE